MQHFKLDALGRWFPWKAGEPINFGHPEGGSRRIEFRVNTDREVSIMAVYTDGAITLIGHGKGLMSFTFATRRDIAVIFAAVPDEITGDDGEVTEEPATIFIETRNRVQRCSPGDEPKFTTIEPRARRQNDVAARFQQLAETNMVKRMQTMMAELDKKRADVEAASQVIEPEEPKVRQPKKKPEEPAPEEGEGDGEN